MAKKYCDICGKRVDINSRFECLGCGEVACYECQEATRDDENFCDDCVTDMVNY